ncbi:MAG TPA: DUF6146 family protein [Sunxiuqinia sp.]|nr:DUF6146 family protein [Sunxiuqinia sp.]
MKYLTIILFALIFASCATQHNVQIKHDKQAEKSADNDSTSYELVVLDPGFDSWYAINSKPSWYHSQDYYEYWNQRYVQAWNYDYQGGRYSKVLETYIDYDPNVDYGLELNHKLFYYFQYVVHGLYIPLISDGPRTY